MKNGHIPEHWQLKLWIGLAALALAAVARQSAIDTSGMSSFNANLIFIGIIVAFVLLYLGFSDFFIKTFESGFDSLFQWFGFKVRQPVKERPPEPVQELPPVQPQIEQEHVDNIQQPLPEQSISEQSAIIPQPGIVKIETPTPKKIVIDYEGPENKLRNVRKIERLKRKPMSFSMSAIPCRHSLTKRWSKRSLML